MRQIGRRAARSGSVRDGWPACGVAMSARAQPVARRGRKRVRARENGTRIGVAGRVRKVVGERRKESLIDAIER